MQEKIIELIMRHVDIMDLIEISSNRIFEASSIKNIDRTNQELDNRNRMMSSISMIQDTIEKNISSISVENIDPIFIEIVQAWAWDQNVWSDRILKIDQNILGLLEQEKESTTEEIATLFQNKQKIGGYNLNTIKK